MKMNKKSKNRTYCSVPQCKSMACKNPSLSFHRFPKEKKLRLRWIHILKIGKEVSDYMSVCSQHFDNTCFFAKEAPTLKKNLKKNSVPSLCLPILPGVDLEKQQQKILEAAKRESRYEARSAVEETGSSSLIEMDDEAHSPQDCSNAEDTLEADEEERLSTAAILLQLSESFVYQRRNRGKLILYVVSCFEEQLKLLKMYFCSKKSATMCEKFSYKEH